MNDPQEAIEAIAKLWMLKDWGNVREDLRKETLDLLTRYVTQLLNLLADCEECDGTGMKDHGEGDEECHRCHGNEKDPEPLLFTKEALKEAGYVQLAEDQSLPEIPFLPSHLYDTPDRAYSEAQQDMLSAGFRKVVLR